jgi:hypothetical protein
MEEDGQPIAEGLPTAAEVTPKRDRKMTLTRVDRRNRVGKRLDELKAIFEAEIDGKISPLQRVKLHRAVELYVIAERERGRVLRIGGSLTEVDAVERRAERACKSLWLSVF